MDVFSYCTQINYTVVTKALGVDPTISPPMVRSTLNLHKWRYRHGFLYFRLHGIVEVPNVWFGQDKNLDLFPALGIESLDGVDLEGATIMTAACYGTEPVFAKLLQAFYDRGAAAVIAGSDRNFAGKGRVIGVDRLARSVMQGLKLGLSSKNALRTAKARLSLTAWRSADRDALLFSIIPRRKK